MLKLCSVKELIVFGATFWHAVSWYERLRGLLPVKHLPHLSRAIIKVVPKLSHFFLFLCLSANPDYKHPHIFLL